MEKKVELMPSRTSRPVILLFYRLPLSQRKALRKQHCIGNTNNRQYLL